jgi:hypothetical protein
MKKRTLQVSLHAREASVVELTVEERVQLDRVTRTPQGCVPERHGNLLEPGVSTIALEPGHYFFKTLSPASLHVIRGGVDTSVHTHDKDGGWPDPSVVNGLGDEAPGEPPAFTVE